MAPLANSQPNRASKGETLELLFLELNGNYIAEQVLFSVQQWRQDRVGCVRTIKATFGDHKIVVRSSALNEDSWATSSAGKYLSVIGVEPASEKIKDAVEDVISTYDENHPENQILIQPEIQDVAVSGVMLTRDLETGAPYWVINYDDVSGRTDTVTSGQENKALRVLKGFETKLRSARFKKLVEIAQKIEKIMGTDYLDIEFCFNYDDELTILQVRPIAAHQNWKSTPDHLIFEQSRNITMQHEALNILPTGARRKKPLFGVMPDWNPAEIVGITPRPLAMSLYKFLITDATWSVARHSMGYQDLRGHPLVVQIGGRPYVNINLSLNSFIPASLDNRIRSKIVSWQLEKLTKRPDLHDKIEFEIAITCLDFDEISRRSYLISAGLNSDQITRFEGALREITQHAVDNFSSALPNLCGKTQKLRDHSWPNEATIEITQIEQLFNSCIDCGTLPFAILARHAFIATSFLKSLVRCNAMTAQRSDEFLRSINTVAEEFVIDLQNVNGGLMTKRKFMSIYGHLRPNTYDVLSSRYDERPEILSGATRKIATSKDIFIPSKKEFQEIGRAISHVGLKISVHQLFDYMRIAIELRERAKFNFTAGVSLGLQALITWSRSIGFSREDLSWLSWGDIQKVLHTKSYSKLIERAKFDFTVNRKLHLPMLITEPDDLVIVRMPLDNPTFITEKTVSGEIKLADWDNLEGLDNKIVAIEYADPGFDHIFSQNIVGLVTKFGGANSHMAIRCAEFGLPAAIGCGQRRYDELVRANRIEIDANNKRINVIGH